MTENAFKPDALSHVGLDTGQDRQAVVEMDQRKEKLTLPGKSN